MPPIEFPNQTIMDDAIAQWHLREETLGTWGDGWCAANPQTLVTYPCGCQGVAEQCATLAHRKDDHEG